MGLQSNIKIEEITLFRHPLLTIYYFVCLLLNYAGQLLHYCLKYYLAILLFVGTCAAILFIPGLQQQVHFLFDSLLFLTNQ